MKSEEDLPAQALIDERTKKQYATPELIMHGSVEKITEQTTAGPNDDNGMGTYDRYSQ
ncbi:MAG: hypothetical protein HY912_00660 [Desulfomonile tiedjei]|uniref:Lasso RiPP family leader peptide-containing protein n=1 Tax=Desulfomonile tiedjei TaxID=2358 RepID=A0A9D6YYQ6_9BACT|nr:hypothetical protein [Desulfomonile tiedjei]